MMWWNGGMDWGGWFSSGILMLVFWGLVIWAIVWLMRSMSAPGRTAPHETPSHDVAVSPEQILAQRFARGEIDEEEYQRRLAVLRSPPPASRSA